MIENKFSPLFYQMAANYNGVKVLLSLLSFKRTDVNSNLIINFIMKNFIKLLNSSISIALCKALITKCNECQSYIIIKNHIFEMLLTTHPSLLFSEDYMQIIVQILEDWGLDTCIKLSQFLIKDICNFTKYSISLLSLFKCVKQFDLCVSIHI